MFIHVFAAVGGGGEFDIEAPDVDCGRGGRVRNYWLSGTSKNTVGKPIFLQGFPTGKPVKIKFLVG